ncbi:MULTISPECIES: DUF1254 domain-containing protein [unclassified Pseudomonas]|uniref:Uncharacterized protein n=1 Tax=Pseudomonas gorinensis TaxID=3240790 RepID=A0ACA7NYM0_9PSED|nr:MULTISPECIES: DUF1254 domain-containing protein [unclassified Pseudomonas]AHC32791.1 hypothetical protein U771_01135 [Pseudomonas sp. TKP]MBL1312147.1 DUF1254 domain-containing protein [Pseudomonas sp.]PMX15860.1 DUF1254 domain-containing protein [Pseudomonas sp. MPBC4-3]PMX39907.1 DUF1254 domain-containing protein [Pseudomonas sp. FW301-21B01]PMY06290.1 DUF1254 domain-containing protein [Pseudomonas sp. MPR-R5A]
MSHSSTACALAMALVVFGSANAQSSPEVAIPVGVDNFVRAESDLYLGKMVASGSLGRFVHSREAVAIDAQNVVRMNRDTLYSSAVFDLEAGPVTITLPEAGGRFMSMAVINEDHYVPLVTYGAGRQTLTKEAIGTRYVFVAVRTFFDPADRKDLEKVHALQDSIAVSQAKVGEFVVPKWDPASQAKVREALEVLGSTIPDYNQSFGPKGAVNPIHHLIGTATGWGGNPAKDAIYLGGVMPENDGKTIYRLKVGEVPVNSFWSVSVYNADGYFQKNPYDAYSLNNLTARKSEDGSIVIQFGGCDGKIANCLPTTPGWNYTVRLYQPKEQILNGKWSFPKPQAVEL